VEALGLRDFTLAGHSTGGAIAVRYMGRHKGYGVSRLVLIAAAAPSLIKRPNFPYGIDEETVLEMIEGTYNDRPQMLKNFGDRFFFQRTSRHFPIVLPVGAAGGRMGNGSDCKDMDK